MEAIILAGGKGTRLRPLTVYTPKPIVPLLNRPFLTYQIEILRRAGITDITLSLSYQPDKIELLLGTGADLGVRLKFITEPSPLGTGGAYRLAADGATDTTIVLNGDVLTEIDVTDLIEFHRSKGAEATLALAPVENPSAYGLVETEAAGKILKWSEKPKPDEVVAGGVNTINAGIYVLEPSILSMMKLGVNSSFEYDVFPRMMAEGRAFFGYVMNGKYWRDIGTPASYLEAHHDFLAGRLGTFEKPITDADEIATHATVDASSVIGSNCIIKPGARIENSVLGNGVQVEEKAVIRDSVVWSHSRIATAAEITRAVIGRNCHIGRNATVGSGAVLGDKTSITDYTRV
jgi:mannose-1-phosphate guanylyltransferase